ncbi:SubName: Full=Related to ERG28-involved in synthesis of ergosterol {ECO:0000313/EMBL:CCA71892.1} [Serendipita indica DSM 11827]|nr:SubName: Full=Related to ERG28-involved in synthesis of ergosterol {ECO:0000313/EMBL:CCA71892.1} [Serendipita indica DSM 11827]
MLDFSAYLPTTDGLLPYWLMLTSAAGIYMAVGNVLHPLHNRIIYTAKPDEVTPLAGRTSGIWTLTTALVRIFCAYNLGQKSLYHLTMCTYVLALAHFGSEFAVYKTAKLGGGVISPFIVASIDIVDLDVEPV